MTLNGAYMVKSKLGLVVTDAGPLIHLHELSALDVLSDYAAVYVPNVKPVRLNKTDLIKNMAEQAEITNVKAESVLNAFMDVITQTLSNKGEVALTGFGTFSTSERSARNGRNPQTGDTIKIPAATVPVFKAGKNLRESVRV